MLVALLALVLATAARAGGPYMMVGAADDIVRAPDSSGNGEYFVLEDNRENSLGSRYGGLLTSPILSASPFWSMTLRRLPHAGAGYSN